MNNANNSSNSNSSSNMNTLQARQHLAITSKRSMPLLVAGMLYWLIGGLVGHFLSEAFALWVYIIGLILIYPLAFIIANVFKANLAPRKNPFHSLVWLIECMLLFCLPLFCFVMLAHPYELPFFIGLVVAAHFLPYVWLYFTSKSYLFLTIGIAVVSVVAGSPGTSSAFTLTPFLLAAVYFLSLCILHFEAQKDRPEWAQLAD